VAFTLQSLALLTEKKGSDIIDRYKLLVEKDHNLSANANGMLDR
jgi:hypothetical protein